MPDVQVNKTVTYTLTLNSEEAEAVYRVLRLAYRDIPGCPHRSPVLSTINELGRALGHGALRGDGGGGDE